jgi:heptosyltransferase-2
MKLGIFLPNWLGDVVMATPTLRALRNHFGAEARIVGIMRPYLAEVLLGTGWLDEQWYFKPRTREPEEGHRELLKRMRRERFDMVVMMPNSLRPAVLSWLAGAGERVGYVRNGRGALLTAKVYPLQRNGRRAASPMVDYYLKLAEVVGCPPESQRLELATLEGDERSADAVFERLGLPSDGRLILLNSSGAYGGSKLWPVEHFGDLARRIVDELDHDVLVICGPNERQIARAVVRRADRPRVRSMAEQPMDLGTAKACIGRGRLMVSTDSGPRHVAAALGKPVVTLFGPMMPIWSENPTVRAANLHLDLDCIGCGKRTCPLGHHRCMRELGVETVFKEVVAMIEEDRSKRAA